MTLRELLSQLAPSRLHDPLPLAAALHDDEGHEAPILVRVFTVVGTWIGAAMLAVIVAALEIYEVVPVALGLAIALFGGAIVLGRRPGRSLALTQLVWAMALGAHALLLGAAEQLQVDEVALAAVWTVLNLAMILAIRVPSFGLASALCAVGFATWLCDLLDSSALLVALPLAGLATWAWIAQTRLARVLGRQWSAIAYGLPIGVVGPLTFVSVDAAGEHLVAVDAWSTSVATVVLAGLLGWVAVQAWREQVASPSEASDGFTRLSVLAALGLLTVIVARHVPGLTLALLWLAIAHLRKSKGLEVIGGIQLAGFTFFFYYQLETTLLLKSLWVMGTGATLMLAALVARPRRAKGDPAPHRPRWLPALALALGATSIVVVGSIQKQRILAEGERVLLPLAPVDPRSLLQGDYMVLRYALEQEIRDHDAPEPSAFEPSAFEAPADLPRHGRLIVVIDDQRVGHFARFDEGGPLGPDEHRIEYRLREGWGGWLRIGAESFLFEEGRGEQYEAARYGELMVAEDGEVVLIGLRDADLQPLGQQLH